jgi:excisionase family DNA binding protein
LTVAEIGQRLKLNQQTIRNMIDRGELAAVRIGQRRVRVRESDLEAFIEAGEARPGVDLAAAREAFNQALGNAHDANDDADLAVALRTLSRTSAALARALTGP